MQVATLPPISITKHRYVIYYEIYMKVGGDNEFF